MSSSVHSGELLPGEEWDEESQATTSTESSAKQGKRSKPGPLRKVPVGMNFSQSVVEEFRKEYGIDPILKPSEEYHAHPHLAYSRNSLELQAVKHFKKNVPNGKLADVGSAARRYEKMSIHCLCPHMQSGDPARLAKAKKLVGRNVSLCEHRLQDCDCGPFSALLFTHSAYYFTTQEIIDAIEATSEGYAYVVGHLFTEAFGVFRFNEGSYRFDLRRLDDWIITKVKGNDHDYTHAPLPWDSGRLGSNGKYLHPERIAQCGDTYLWIVRIGTVDPTIAPSRAWQEILVDQTHIGPIQIPGFDSVTKQSLSANGLVSVEVDHLYGWRGWLFSNTTTGRVYMPRGAIEDAAMKIMGKNRDPALMKDVIYIMRNSLSSSRLPPAVRLQAVTIGAALAFNLNVQNEIDVAHTLTSRYTPLWKLHAALYALTPQRAITIWVLLIVFGVLLLAFMSTEIPLLVTNHDEPQYTVPPLVLFGLGVCILGICCCTMCVARYQARRTSDNWSTTLYVEGRAPHITGDLAQPLLTRYPHHPHLRAPAEVESGTIEIGRDPQPPRHPGTLQTPLLLDGVGVANAVPTAPRTDQQSEVTAITHRILAPVTSVAHTALEKFISLSGLAARKLLTIRVEGSESMYEDWMNSEKWTERQKTTFRKAWAKSEHGMKISRGMFHAFVKFEKMKVVNFDICEPLKTRLINGPPDVVKVAVGPWMSRIQKAVCKIWNGYDCPIYYTSGSTPDEIGRVVDRFAMNCGGWNNVVAVWDDCALYDSTLENELLSLRDILYPKMGVPERTMEWLHSTISGGITTHGVRYKLAQKLVAHFDKEGRPEWGIEVLRRLFSGELDTNLIGSIINGVAHESGIREGLKWLMLVCGDDNFILFSRNGFDLEVASELKTHLEELGLRPAQGISDRRCDWEFCSKLFWLGKDKQSGEIQTVLGPKPARWLSRIGWSLKTPNEPNFPEVMMSARDDTHHIPLLNVYVRTGLEMCKGRRRTGKVWSEMRHVSKAYDCVPENIEIIQERYHISNEEFLRSIEVIQRMSDVGTIVNLPWVATGAKRDEE